MASLLQFEKRLLPLHLLKFSMRMTYIFFTSFAIYAGEKEIPPASIDAPSPLAETPSSFRKPQNHRTETSVTEALSTEALWFGFSEEVRRCQ
ncbi:MAG: hypothetical protein E3K40_15580 [Candidatus Brocadia sp.]|nr:hypothetical protein [Candidatus Brocadia sp.]